MLVEAIEFLPRGHVPQSGSPVPASREQTTAVRGKGQAVDHGIAVPLPATVKFLAAVQIPDAQGEVEAGGGCPATVRRQHDARDLAPGIVPLEGLQLVTSGGVPEGNDPIPRRQDLAAIGGEAGGL